MKTGCRKLTHQKERLRELNFRMFPQFFTIFWTAGNVIGSRPYNRVPVTALIQTLLYLQGQSDPLSRAKRNTKFFAHSAFKKTNIFCGFLRLLLYSFCISYKIWEIERDRGNLLRDKNLRGMDINHNSVEHRKPLERYSTCTRWSPYHKHSINSGKTHTWLYKDFWYST